MYASFPISGSSFVLFAFYPANEAQEALAYFDITVNRYVSQDVTVKEHVGEILVPVD
jgi:hypothetical protein